MRPLSCRCTHPDFSRAERLQRFASCFLSAAVSGDASIVKVEAAGDGGTTLTSAAEPDTRQRQTRSSYGITSVLLANGFFPRLRWPCASVAVRKNLSVPSPRASGGDDTLTGGRPQGLSSSPRKARRTRAWTGCWRTATITQQARYWRDAGFRALASGMTGTGLQVLRRLAGYTVRLKRCVRVGVAGLVSALAAGTAGLPLPFPSADGPGGLAADWVKALPCFRGLVATP